MDFEIKIDVYMYKVYCSFIFDDNKFLLVWIEIYIWVRFFENILFFIVMKLLIVYGYDLVF